jgi:class 3 adenylate cyclase
MPREIPDIVIMFVDISGSTRLYETLGNEPAYKLVTKWISILSDIIDQHQGTLIKTIGDEVMCTFADAYQAINAAIKMNNSFEDIFKTRLKKNLRPGLRIGLQTGRVIRQGNDVFGDAVNMAARMVSLAKPKQILTTQEMIDELPSDLQGKSRFVDKTRIKGKDGEFNIYEVIWNEGDMTIMLFDGPDCRVQSEGLHLRYGRKDVYMDKDKPALTLGRLPENDLIVDDGIASRFHARIEYHRGKFVLIDQSSNGTYVFLDGEKPSLIHHDECVLSNHGYISLGREAKAGSPEIIRFSCNGQKK